ncbi:MAG: hypothetical protein L3V56_13185, partial [Candidatus Magnetoovum sp. WYHC-5]|nr:hypothetical protein [Candidatus Magnetoovum sp. WYHC-5]
VVWESYLKRLERLDSWSEIILDNEIKQNIGSILEALKSLHAFSKHNITYIYNLFKTIDEESLKKIAEGDTKNLTDGVLIKVDEILGAAEDVGWGYTEISKAINMLLDNKHPSEATDNF